MSKISIVRTDEVEGIETPEGLMKPLTLTKEVLMIHMEVPAGLEVSPHAHQNDCILFMLSGSINLIQENSSVRVNPGDVVLVPANVKVGLTNNSDSNAEILAIVLSPNYASLEEFKQRLMKLMGGKS